MTVRQVLHRWNANGPAGLADGRKGNGSQPKLPPRRRDALYAASQKRPPDGGLWTGPKVARYVADRWGVGVDPTTGWRWRRDLGFTLQGPRPAHPHAADAPTRRRWKKLATAGPPAEGGPPGPRGGGVGGRRGPVGAEADHPPDVMAEGDPPAVGGRTRYEWLYVYAFVRPRTGESFTVIQPRVRVERMADAPAAFAAHADPDGVKMLVPIVDNAGWHRAKRLAVPANVRLHFLPPCTPELQPVEPFRVLVREGVANDTFDRLGQLRRVIRRRCRKLAADPATVYGAVGFRWAVKLET